MNGTLVWHDVECAAYAADLPLWQELGEAAGGAVLDLGCGSGRVTLRLAGAGRHVVGLDSDRDLIAALNARAREARLAIEAHVGDVRTFSLGRRFPLAIAPMQVVQLLGGRAGRAALLACAAAHLEPGGLLALALADPLDGVPPDACEPPLPDVRECDGWVYSSRPLAIRAERGAIAIERLRQAVSPEGELSEELHTVRLDTVTSETLESEARQAGLQPAGRRQVPPTDAYVGSTVVLLRSPLASGGSGGDAP